MRTFSRTRVAAQEAPKGGRKTGLFTVLAPALAGSFLAAGLGCGGIVEGESAGSGLSTGTNSSSSSASGASAASFGDSGPGSCGVPQSLDLTSPGESAVNPVWIAVDAGVSVARVVYEAEGAQLLGESSDPETDFGIEVTFMTLGPRTIQATAYDSCDGVVATASQVTVVSDDGEGGDELGDPVCYPGPDEDWDVCFELVLPAPEELDNYDYPSPLNMNPHYRAPQAYIDLDGIDLEVSVAPNFQFSELVKPNHGNLVVIQPHAVVRLQALRDQLGALQVNSGYRNPSHNASVDGATWSRHMYGDAFDISPSDVSLGELYDACADEDADFRKLYETHVHCDWREHSVDTRFFGPIDGDAVAPDESVPLAAALIADGDGFVAPASGWDEGEPLRRWWAFDDDGVLLEEAVGRRFVPPIGATRVEVEVGGELRRSIDID